MPKEERLIICTSDDKVLLKEFVPQDAQPLFELINNNRDHLSKWGDETATKYPDYKSALESITNPRNPQKRRLGIWYDDVFAGSINITPHSKLPMIVEIGYWVGSDFCGKGFAKIATHAIVDHLKRLEGVDLVIAVTRVENIASRLVLQKAGLVQVRKRGDYTYFILNVEN